MTSEELHIIALEYLAAYIDRSRLLGQELSVVGFAVYLIETETNSTG
jgi:hypothetical protein